MDSFWDSEKWQILKQEVILRDRERCFICQRRYSLTVHHIKPRKEDGDDTLRNLITLCAKCHDDVEGENWGFILNRKKEKQEEIFLLRTRKIPTKQYLKKYGYKITSYRLRDGEVVKLGERWTI